MKAIKKPEDRGDWKGGVTLIISLLALTASAFSAYVASESARLSKDSTLVSRRPIIATDTISPAGIRDYARFTFKNAGSSPALDVLIKGKAELKAPMEEPSFDDYTDWESKGVLGPGASVDQGIKLPSLSKEDVAALQNQSKLLYVHGLISYKDLWNQPHWFRFCYKLNQPLDGYYSCLKHNAIDN